MKHATTHTAASRSCTPPLPGDVARRLCRPAHPSPSASSTRSRRCSQRGCSRPGSSKAATPRARRGHVVDLHHAHWLRAAEAAARATSGDQQHQPGRRARRAPRHPVAPIKTGGDTTHSARSWRAVQRVQPRRDRCRVPCPRERDDAAIGQRHPALAAPSRSPLPAPSGRPRKARGQALGQAAGRGSWSQDRDLLMKNALLGDRHGIRTHEGRPSCFVIPRETSSDRPADPRTCGSVGRTAAR